MGKLTAIDTDGFSLEEVEGSEVEEAEERQRNEEDQDCSEKQVICILFVIPSNVMINNICIQMATKFCIPWLNLSSTSL